MQKQVENTNDSYEKIECGRWDLNPRTPKRLAPQASAFGQAGRHPQKKFHVWFLYSLITFRKYAGTNKVFYLW